MRSTMLIRRAGLVTAALSGVLVGAAASADQGGEAPAIEGVFPPGARIGEERTWTVRGRGLGAIREFRVTGEGVEVEPEGAASDSEAVLRVRVRPGAEPGYRELRAIGPKGASNMLIVRIDHLAQSLETEPNDASGAGEPLSLPIAVAGTLGPQDTDTFRFAARAGHPITIEVECRRLGVPLVPILNVADPSGRPLEQGREVVGLSGDSRCVFRPRTDGIHFVSVRDLLFAGGACAHYRLRILDGAVPTGAFPLGGAAGSELTLTARGPDGEGCSKRLRLDERPGFVSDAGLFPSSLGPEILPFRIISGPKGGIEGVEGDGAPVLAPGVTLNGRIGAPGEVDHYRLRAQGKQKVRLRVRAGELGSWLDSVLTIRDAQGKVVADNDEPPPGLRLGAGALSGEDPTVVDSLLNFEPEGAGEWTVEVRDRDGRGGPEYPYRLECSSARPEFAIFLLMRPNTVGQRVRTGVSRGKPGANGTLNLKRGVPEAIDFQLSAIDFAGRVEVRAEGLPEGVTAEAVRARIAARGPRNNTAVRSVTDRIILRAAKDAPIGMGGLRIIAALIREDGTREECAAVFPVTMDAVKMQGPGRPVERELPVLPIMVVE